MFWPLIAGFIVIFLLTLLIGWLVDPARQRNREARLRSRPPIRPRSRL